jgi:hypothetical protein
MELMKLEKSYTVPVNESDGLCGQQGKLLESTNETENKKCNGQLESSREN